MMAVLFFSVDDFVGFFFRPKRTSDHERLYIHETAGTPSVTLAVVVTRTLLCNDYRAVRVSLPEPVLGLLFFFLERGYQVHTSWHIIRTLH